jgi:hypothetical protein
MKFWIEILQICLLYGSIQLESEMDLYDPGGMSFLGMLMTFALIVFLFVAIFKYIVF